MKKEEIVDQKFTLPSPLFSFSEPLSGFVDIKTFEMALASTLELFNKFPITCEHVKSSSSKFKIIAGDFDANLFFDCVCNESKVLKYRMTMVHDSPMKFIKMAKEASFNEENIFDKEHVFSELIGVALELFKNLIS